MRILILNQAYWPDVVATAQHMTDWAEYLAAHGHEVTVIASRSVYGKQGAALPKRETHNGVHIIRVGSNLFSKKGLLSRGLDFALFHVRSLFRTMLLPRQEVIVCLTTPPFIGVVGMLAKWFRGSRFVQYEMDVYPDVAVALGALKPRSLAHRIFDRLHRRLLKSAARVIVLGRDMQTLIAAKKIPAAKLVMVTPWADPTEIVPAPRDSNPFRLEHNLQNAFVVMYSGNLGLGHDITTICAAMKDLTGDPTVRFVFIGGGKRMKEVTQFCQQNNLPVPLMLDYQPRERLSQTLSAADAHLITQAPSTTGLIVPSKLYGILAAGRPIVYVGPADTEVAFTLSEHGLGEIIAIGDAGGLIGAIRKRQADVANLPAFEARARELSARLYSRQACCAKLTATVESLSRPAH